MKDDDLIKKMNEEIDNIKSEWFEEVRPYLEEKGTPGRLDEGGPLAGIQRKYMKRIREVKEKY